MNLLALTHRRDGKTLPSAAAAGATKIFRNIPNLCWGWSHLPRNCAAFQHNWNLALHLSHPLQYWSVVTPSWTSVLRSNLKQHSQLGGIYLGNPKSLQCDSSVMLLGECTDTIFFFEGRKWATGDPTQGLPHVRNSTSELNSQPFLQKC